MDSNSRRAQARQQFNMRSPKRTPVSVLRHSDLSSRKATPEVKRPPNMSSSAPSSSVTSLKTPRPIVTNSRVKDKEDRVRTAYLAFAREALQNKANGDDARYNEMIEQFDLKKITPDAPSPTPQLRLWLLALSHVVSRLDKQYHTLVQAIVDLPWTTMDLAFVQSYTSFIGILVSARPEYLTLILGKAARGFTYQSGLRALDASGPEGSSNPLTRKDVYKRIHLLLQHLLELIPTLPSVLEPFLVKNFPHKRQVHAAQVTYIRNLLQVSKYCPHLSDKILSLIIERAIQIDVEIQIEIDDLEELAAERGDTSDEIFDIDPFESVIGNDSAEDSEEDDDDADDNFSDLSSEAESVDEGEEPKEPPGMDVPHIQDMVNKLDSVLKLIFEHFSNPERSSSSVRSNSPSTPRASAAPETGRTPSPDAISRARATQRAQFLTLLGIFDRTILRTFKSRYTQFLVFWFAARDPAFGDLFQGMLVERALLDARAPPVERAAAAAYLASLVSRAAFVGRAGARAVVRLLCGYLREHLDVADAVVLPAAQHGIFFASAQAVFLIFCFRWRDLGAQVEGDAEGDADADVEADDRPAAGRKWMPELLVLQRAVTSPLNPLKFCAPNVVNQFARVAHTVDFMYCYSILEANKRADFGAGNAGGSAARRALAPDTALNAFFPFDPYNLPRSAAYIAPVYRDWASVAIGDEDEDEDEEDEEDEDAEDEDVEDEDVEDEDVEDEEHVGGDEEGEIEAVGEDPGQLLGQSFEGMSISPMRPAVLT